MHEKHRIVRKYKKRKKKKKNRKVITKNRRELMNKGMESQDVSPQVILLYNFTYQIFTSRSREWLLLHIVEL